MPKHALVVPTYPAQRVIRTVLVDVVVWGPTLLVVAPAVLEAAQGLTTAGVLPASVYAKLAAITGAALALSGALARIIALPRLNRLLTRFGAGTVPRRAARAGAVRAVKDTRAAVDALSYATHDTP